MDSIETLQVIPDPVSLIESMRAVGYTVEAAVADIVDNSLSADSQAISIKYDASDSPFVAILDDGYGMEADELTNAMRHGSSNPADKRAPGDLGRFGLGLKTASLSQCRKLTVVSKKNGRVSSRRWDLDVVHRTEQWVVVIPNVAELQQLPLYKRLDEQVSGTLVVWQDLDRLCAGSRKPVQEMTAKMAPLLDHLALVFHRFAAPDPGFQAIKISVNSLPLPQRDPFLSCNHFRQVLEGQVLKHDKGIVRVSPYVLPPMSSMSKDEIEMAGGSHGLRGTQGFYVYRNRRLVIWGTWFRLVPKDEFYKLTRVQVDIPNSFDDLWALDIKKSAAYPPDAIRERLKALIPHFAGVSKRTVTYKGRQTNVKSAQPLWLRNEVRRGTVRYTINPDHPVVREVGEQMDPGSQRNFQTFLDIVSGSIPYESIYADMCVDDRSVDGAAQRSELMALARSLLQITGLSVDQVLEIDPLCHYPELHDFIKGEI